jgi:hypothetical protein
MERWAIIQEAPRYEVSSLGQVRHARTGRIKKQTPGDEGYLQVMLYVRAKTRVCRKVHVLVAEAFLGEKPDGMDNVDHKDRCRTHNADTNLRWATWEEQHENREVATGARNGRSKLTEEAVAECRRRYAAGGVTHKQLAQEFGVSRAAISYAIRGLKWRHVC